MTGAKPAAEHPVVSRVGIVVKKHTPVIPRELGNGADIRGRTFELSLRGFPIEVINIEGSI